MCRDERRERDGSGDWSRARLYILLVVVRGCFVSMKRVSCLEVQPRCQYFRRWHNAYSNKNWTHMRMHVHLKKKLG